MNRHSSLAAAALLAFGLCPLGQAISQEAVRPVALVNARILTMTEAGTIDSGTVLIRGETIEAVGADVTIPPGASVIDLEGGTVMPGLVHAWSTAGLQSGGGGIQLPANIPDRFRRRFRSSRSGSSRPTATPSKKVSDSLYARQDVFGDMLDAGVTTLVVRPQGSGLPGMAARLNPGGGDDDLVVDDDAYIVIRPQNTQAAAKVLKDMMAKGKKALEERKKPKEEPKKPEEAKKPEAEDKKPAEGEKPKEGETPKPEPKPEPKPTPDPKPEPQPKPEEKKPEPKQDPKKPAEQKKPAKKKDPNAEVLADLLDEKRRAFVNLSTGADFLHWKVAMKDMEDVSFPAALIADSRSTRSGRLDQVLEQVKGFDAPVLTSPTLETLPSSRTLISQPKALHDAGVEVGFLLPDSKRQVEQVWFQLMELARTGMPADAVLAGVTHVPAKALGLEKEIGSLAEGLRADLLVFTGDPLDPTSTMTHVFHGGRSVREETDAR